MEGPDQLAEQGSALRLSPGRPTAQPPSGWVRTISLDSWVWLNSAAPGVHLSGPFAVQPLPADELGAPPAELIDAGLATAEATISPSGLDVLMHAAHPLVRVRVRAWTGDRVVIATWAVGVDSAVAMLRLQRVDPDAPGGPTVMGAGSGMRLGVIGLDEVIDGLIGCLPPVFTQAGEPERERQVRLPWPECTALLDALAATEAGFGTAAAPVSAAIQARFPGSAAPALFRDLAVGLTASCEVVIEAASSVRIGSWLAGPTQVVALRAGGDAGDDPAGIDPAKISVELVAVSGEQIRADLIRSLTAALDAALA